MEPENHPFEKVSEPNLHDFGFQPLNLGGVYRDAFLSQFKDPVIHQAV